MFHFSPEIGLIKLVAHTKVMKMDQYRNDSCVFFLYSGNGKPKAITKISESIPVVGLDKRDAKGCWMEFLLPIFLGVFSVLDCRNVGSNRGVCPNAILIHQGD